MIEMRLSEVAAVTSGVLVGDDLRFCGLCTDSREDVGGRLFCALSGPNFDGNRFAAAAADRGAVAAITTAADPALPCVVVADTRVALGALAAYWRSRFQLECVGITGSNGKTTVKEMVARIAAADAPVLATEGNLNNEIGVPLTLSRLDTAHRRLVVEMGANAPGEIARLASMARPRIGVVTQIAPAHLAGFGSIDGVARAKGELFASLPDCGVMVFDAACPFASLWRELAPGRRILRFGFGAGAQVLATHRTGPAGEALRLSTPVGDLEVLLPLFGRHNVANAAAAAAASVAMGLDTETIARGLAAMRPVRGRLAPVSGVAGARVLDDSYNANPASLRAALEVLAASPSPRWLVLGDMAELGPRSQELHCEAGRLARELKVERLWCTGELTRATASCFGPGASHFDEIESLIDALENALDEGVTVLVKGSRSARMERVVNALCAGQPACC